MELSNGSGYGNALQHVAIDARPIRQLVRARDVAEKLGVQCFLGDSARIWQAQALSSGYQNGDLTEVP